jgi:hypothetical protein
MRIQAFIPTWHSPTTDEYRMLHALETHCETTILDAYDVPFAQQWEEAVSRFTGDIFLWAMADVEPGNFEDMFPRMVQIYERGDIAMYAPNIHYSSQRYDKSKLRYVEPDLYEVCGTDLLFCSLTSELLLALPSLGGNSHAWSYDYLMTVIAHKQGKRVVRDYRFDFVHPEGSIYNKGDAMTERCQWFMGLPTQWQLGIREQTELQAKLVGND